MCPSVWRKVPVSFLVGQQRKGRPGGVLDVREPGWAQLDASMPPAAEHHDTAAPHLASHALDYEQQTLSGPGFAPIVGVLDDVSGTR